jgi:hypothetical protein
MYKQSPNGKFIVGLPILLIQYGYLVVMMMDIWWYTVNTVKSLGTLEQCSTPSLIDECMGLYYPVHWSLL